MSDWRSSVESEAEQVVEYHGLSAHNVEAVETLTDDPLFQELALAYHRANLAYDAAMAADDVERDGLDDPVNEVHTASDKLLKLLRDRGRTLLSEVSEQ